MSSDPTAIERPLMASLEGNFPQQGISQIHFSASRDCSTDVSIEKFKARVGVFPVHQKVIVASDELKFLLTSAIGSAGFAVEFQGNKISLTADSQFQRAIYQVSAQSKVLESILQGVVKDIPKILVDAQVSGSFDHLQFIVQSNLASALEKGFEKQLRARLEESRKKLDAMIQAQIGTQKKELTDQLKSVTGQTIAQIETQKRKAEDVQGQASHKITALQSQLASLHQQAQQQGIGAARKAFGF